MKSALLKIAIAAIMGAAFMAGCVGTGVLIPKAAAFEKENRANFYAECEARPMDEMNGEGP